ncbi:hypothetical protein C8R42DRAFT_645685 [Lentinula raphanica]|nr:hypothetical protein C8R42DRAFT_645685 [Lentinula raphanica]
MTPFSTKLLSFRLYGWIAYQASGWSGMESYHKVTLLYIMSAEEAVRTCSIVPHSHYLVSRRTTFLEGQHKDNIDDHEGGYEGYLKLGLIVGKMEYAQLRNFCFWMEEYQFDGFRFDGVMRTKLPSWRIAPQSPVPSQAREILFVKPGVESSRDVGGGAVLRGVD